MKQALISGICIYLFTSFFTPIYSQKSLNGVWLADTYQYRAGKIVQQKLLYTFNDSLVKLQLQVASSDPVDHSQSFLPLPIECAFYIREIVYTSKSAGKYIVRLIDSLDYPPKYQILHFSQHNGQQVRIHFTLGNNYTLEQAQQVAQKHIGKLFVRRSLYNQWQRLPKLAKVDSTSFAQLQQAVQKQVRKQRFKRMIKRGISLDDLKTEVLMQTLLHKGQNPYQSQYMIIAWQQQQMEQRKAAQLRQRLKIKQVKLAQLKLSLTNTSARHTRQKIRYKATQTAIRLIEKELAHIELRQKLIRLQQQEKSNTKVYFDLLGRMRKLKQEIEVLSEQCFIFPGSAIRFKPIKVNKD